MSDWIQWGITTIIGILALLGGRYWGKHDRKIRHDKEVLDRILKAMPGNGSIKFIKEKDFRGSYSPETLDDLDKLFNLNNLPEIIFLDKKLENLRKKLVDDSNEFDSFLASNSFPLNTPNARINKIKAEYEYDDSTEYHIIVNKIHDLADKVCQSYYEFVTTAIKRLN